MNHLDVLAILVACSAVLASATAGETALPAKHPNLLLNREEINAIKIKVAENEWAAKLLEQAKEMAAKNDVAQAAICYAITGEKRFADIAHNHLLGSARGWAAQCQKADLQIRPEEFNWGPWGMYAWAYDLAYDTFTDAERREFEDSLRTVCKLIIEGDKLWTTTPNLIFGKHFNVGIVGYCLGDKALIDWGLNDPGAFGPAKGGFYQVLDSMIKDGRFWAEAPIYALCYDVHGMLALAEAARHYDGSDLYSYVSKASGASIKPIIDGYLLAAFPVEKTGVNRGSVRAASFGDGSTMFWGTGEMFEYSFLMNPVSGNFGDVGLNGELELAYAHYKDPGYAWLLSLNPNRNALTSYGRAVFGLVGLTHGVELPGNLTPPPAPCGIYPSQGFAVLRSDETPAYWTSGALTAVMRLGSAIGHGHQDFYSIVLHGKGRLLYPDLNVIQYEPTYLGWTREGIAHSTLLVDGVSPHAGECSTRSDFTPEAKFFAASGSAFDGTRQTRALLVTKDYAADIFRVQDDQGQPRTFDWVLHGFGRLYPGNPAAYRPSQDLVANYWWIDNERSRTAGTAWQADFVQHSGGVVPGVQPFGKEWFQQNIGVRMTMLPGPDTRVFCGDGPMADGAPHHRIDGNPEGALPLVIARRTGAATTFAAVHEPYDGRPAIRRVRPIAETADATGIAIDADAFSDRVLVAFTPDKQCTVTAADGETFAFTGYCYVRAAGKEVSVRGQVTALKLRASDGVKVTVNGKPQSVKQAGEFVVFGKLPEPAAPAKPAVPDALAERQAALQYYFMPEEAHLSAGKDREVELRLRCVGQGQAKGRLKFVTPKGIAVEPATVDVPAMADGEERTVLLRVKAAADAANALHTIKVEPVVDPLALPMPRAASGTLLASVGVVMTENRVRPRLAEWVVRAPGYTIGVDEFSGTSFYLLDGDGHRRFGRVHGANFIFGFPGVMRDGKWAFVYRHPCRFVWVRKNSLEIGSDGTYNDGDIRLQYVFSEDQIAISLKPPTRPDLDHTVWLGNFDALGAASKTGTIQQADGKAVDWQFFPHAAYRQGVLLTVPNKVQVNNAGTAVYMVLRTGQEVTLKFVTPQEVPKQ